MITYEEFAPYKFGGYGGTPTQGRGPSMDMDFWAQYEQFFPLMSNYQFGDNFAANMDGGSAMLSGNNLPDINQAIALNGPEIFPAAAFWQGVNETFAPGDDAIRIGVGLDQATQNQRMEPTRFNAFLNRIGVGMLAVILIAAGILYLGLVGYKKVAT